MIGPGDEVLYVGKSIRVRTRLLSYFRAEEKEKPAEIIRKKYLCLQAAYYSSMERGGAPVTVGSVPADWALPAWRPRPPRARRRPAS